jgi:hypothetical protein
MAPFRRWRRRACFVCAPRNAAPRGELIQVCSAIVGRSTSGKDDLGFREGPAVPEHLSARMKYSAKKCDFSE